MAEEWIPENKHELMAEIRREWGLLMDVVARLDERQMSRPDAGGWSPKDNLAHLTEWMKSKLGHHIDRLPAHEVLDLPEEITRGWDMEVINPELFERNKDRPTQEVVDELRHTYDEVIKNWQHSSSRLFSHLCWKLASIDFEAKKCYLKSLSMCGRVSSNRQAMRWMF